MDSAGRTSMHYSAMNNHVEEVRRQLHDGLDPNAAGAHGFTPLHFAAQEHAVDALRELLVNGASVDARNGFGNTSLFTAVFNSRGRGDVIELLRAYGAGPLARNYSGQTPLSLARSIANYDVARHFADIEE
ncbi:ankyrin repeat domain-containing protein [Actinopolymorpha alba]|uniref:ankyrin repeat domain-containing protein n=1 Tax=Actinopolymorpha alba TaxID=533267 RepID=UPI000364EF3A|nr:ankyrin repeat domain-containing protein [Actinopolymorpha alba]